MLPTIKFGEKNMTTLNYKHSFMWSAPKNSYLSPRTYSGISAELVEARVDLTSFEHVLNRFKTVTTIPEQPVNVSELLKSPARNTKANYE